VHRNALIFGTIPKDIQCRRLLGHQQYSYVLCIRDDSETGDGQEETPGMTSLRKEVVKVKTAHTLSTH